MDYSKKYYNPSPELSTNIFSRIFFCWILPFMKNAYKNDLQMKDIYNAHKNDLCGPIADQLQKNWNEELEKTNTSKVTPSLLKVLFKTFYKSYLIYGFFYFLGVIVIKSFQPIVLAEYIRYFAASNKSNNPQTGWLLATAFIFLMFLFILLYHHAQLGCQRVGMRARVACCSLVYRKILRLSQASLKQTSAGQILNLLSNDLQRFDNVSWYLHYLWIMPVQAAVSFYIMYRSVGLAALAGLILMVLEALPLQGFMSKAQGKLRLKIANKSDYRIKLISEIISGIKAIKLYAWEEPFDKVVKLARKLEIDIVTKASYIRGFSLSLMLFTGRMSLYLTLLAYVFLGNRLTADVVFSVSQLINTVELYMCIFYPHALANFAEAKVSIKRLQKFLLMEENESKATTKNSIKIVKSPGEIKTKKATVNKSSVDTHNINLDINPGMLCCVVGTVGSGKTSLLHMLMEELPSSCGNVEISGVISYASQEPWLFVSSVRNNILFGREYDKKRYDEVIRVCALERDLELFPHGDKTLVEERGMSLSGGQRARINLARAVYANADVYLLDDPFSSVDIHVCKHIFEECVMKYLNGKTRILVTDNCVIWRKADLIIKMENSKIKKIGTFEELSNNELSSMVQLPVEEFKQAQKINSKKLHGSFSDIYPIAEGKVPEKSEEEVETGVISLSLYGKYYRYGAGIFCLGFLVFMMLLAQLCTNGADYWITYWTNILETEHKSAINTSSNENFTFQESVVNKSITIRSFHQLNDFIPFNNTPKSYYNYTILKDTSFPSTQQDFILIYTSFIVTSIIFTSLRSLLFFKIMMNASKGLHNDMFGSILKTPMKFFDTNPSGRILNRFSYDMGIVDELLPRITLEALQIFLVMSGNLIIVFIVSPMMIVPTVILATIFFYLSAVYVKIAEDIKRLEGVNKGLEFSHITASLNGITTIRASKAEGMISKEFDRLQDQHTSTWYMSIASSEIFGFYLDLVYTVFLALATFQFLIFGKDNIPGGNVGLVISQASGFFWEKGIRRLSEVASYMTSVERILQYTKLESEVEEDRMINNIIVKKLTYTNPEKCWPQAGGVMFKDTILRYDPDAPPVLKHLNFRIKGGEKVGVVGRTGAGKSSLISSIFRLVPVEGTISIDDVDISKISLKMLRSHISIIPQEPVLFSSTVRFNLDPFNNVDDDVLWKALENVELKGAVKNLNEAVSEGGCNFSAGQRQLFCLARALVRNNKILVMDEATANVDCYTDLLIQKTIQENFKGCTVLTIAHRLNTIVDSDKVLVMDAGEAVEFAHPHKLLQDRNGYFSKMVSQLGYNEVVIRKQAEEDYKKSLGLGRIKPEGNVPMKILRRH